MSNHETPTYNQISEQYSSDHSEPTVLIRRGDTIQTASLTKYADNEGRRYVTFDDNGENRAKPIAGKNLTDEHQLNLAQELAGNYELPSDQETEQLVAVVKTVGREAVNDAFATQARVEISPDKSRMELRDQDIARSVRELDRTLDPKLAAIFRGVTATPEARRTAIDPNTGNQEKREALESLLRITIDQIGGEGKLPERVQRNDLNDLKSVADQKLGYQDAKYPPRDYAAKVALAMLDGSFKGDPRKRDYADLSADDPRNGQHRQAAIMALDRLMHDKVPEVEQSSELGESMRQARKLLGELVNSELLNRTEALIHQAEINPDELVSKVGALQNSIDELRSRISRLNPESADEDRALVQMGERLVAPAHMVGDAHNDVMDWSRYLAEQGNSPGIRHLRDGLTHQLDRAIQQLKQIR